MLFNSYFRVLDAMVKAGLISKDDIPKPKFVRRLDVTVAPPKFDYMIFYLNYNYEENKNDKI
jgi:hypothetical protein